MNYLETVSGLTDELTAAYSRLVYRLSRGHEVRADEEFVKRLLQKRPQDARRIVKALIEKGLVHVDNGWIRLGPNASQVRNDAPFSSQFLNDASFFSQVRNDAPFQQNEASFQPKNPMKSRARHVDSNLICRNPPEREPQAEASADSSSSLSLSGQTETSLSAQTEPIRAREATVSTDAASGARSLPHEAHAPLAPPPPGEDDREPVREDIGYGAAQQPGRKNSNPSVQDRARKEPARTDTARQQPGRTHGVKTGPLDQDDMARLRQWRHDVMRDADLNDRTAGKPGATGAPDRPTAFQEAWAKYQAGDRSAFLPRHEAPIMGGSALRSVIREQLNLPPVSELSEELAGKLTSGGIENSALYRRAMANDAQAHTDPDNGAELPGHEPAQAGAGQGANQAGPGTGQVAPVSAAGAARHADPGEHDDGARPARDEGGHHGLNDDDIDAILKF